MRPAMAAPPWLLPAFSFESVSLGAGSASEVLRSTGPDVELGEVHSKLELVLFSWKIPPRKAVEEIGVLLVVDDDDDNTEEVEVEVEVKVEDGDELVVEVGIDEVEVDVDVDDGVDDVVVVEDVVGVEEVVLVVLVVVGVELVVGAADDVVDSTGAELVEEPPPDPSKNDTTMLALEPLGTVTTQKGEPPAPEASLSLTTPLPSTLQGMPLQSSLGHSISRPYSGLVPESDESCHTGFMPTFTNVEPSATVLAPATYGDQFPIGLLDSPQIQPTSEAMPGALI